MTFGIIGAMEEEIIQLKEKISVKCIKKTAGMDFYEGSYCGRDIILVKSGIGKVNAAVCVQALVDHFGVKAVINTGIAGSMDKKVHLGDVVISADLVQHDFDTSAFEGEPRGFIPRLGMRFFQADKALIDLALKSAQSVLTDSICHMGRIASGDQFISDESVKKEIADYFKPLCVEMEGAAIAQACYLNDVPFVIIRSISDNSDGNVAVYENYSNTAARLSSCIVEKIIEGYGK